MKQWFIVAVVVAVLLGGSTGVGFWKFMDTQAELAVTKDELAKTKNGLEELQAELSNVKEGLTRIEAVVVHEKVTLGSEDSVTYPLEPGRHDRYFVTIRSDDALKLKWNWTGRLGDVEDLGTVRGEGGLWVIRSRFGLEN